jgi:hypothetical protein
MVGGVAIETGLYDRAIGVPQLIKGIRRAAMPVAREAPVSATVVIEPAPAAAPKPAGAVASAERTTLGLGLVPALALVVAGMLLL